MTDNQRATQFAKLEITGTLEVLTGLHIGTGGGFSAIGATDKPVVRDPLTKLPLIPGTSLKGKVRTLLSRQYAADEGSFADKPAADHPTIRRLFGDTEEFMTGRLIFRDTRLANKDELVSLTRQHLLYDYTVWLHPMDPWLSGGVAASGAVARDELSLRTFVALDAFAAGSARAFLRGGETQRAKYLLPWRKDEAKG